MTTQYKSDVSEDTFVVEKVKYTSIIKNTDQQHTIEKEEYIIKLEYIDKLIENLSLLISIIDELSSSETHILYKYNTNCIYPQFKFERIKISNQYYTRFTLKQFKRFYIDNIQNIINVKNVYINNIEQEDGWTVVMDFKKMAHDKINSIYNEFKQINK